ncbi:hypothetical protein H6P87_00139 [Rickettsia tillamookensis]|uniref:Uncharacterized protein n=1 Tax=Rickettsia tillamookensis TaxID=2761623 RepID=A0A9E6SPY5_9RICK|nr:hypothetical protein H6P87_00139 [Rickettsia tillamookensis]
MPKCTCLLAVVLSSLPGTACVNLPVIGSNIIPDGAPLSPISADFIFTLEWLFNSYVTLRILPSDTAIDTADLSRPPTK